MGLVWFSMALLRETQWFVINLDHDEDYHSGVMLGGERVG